MRAWTSIATLEVGMNKCRILFRGQFLTFLLFGLNMPGTFCLFDIDSEKKGSNIFQVTDYDELTHEKLQPDKMEDSLNEIVSDRLDVSR